VSRRVRLGRSLQEGGLYGLLFLLPFSKAAVEIGFGILLLGWLLERLGSHERPRSGWEEMSRRPLLLMMTAYLGVCALSIAVSGHPALSVRGVVGKWLEYLLFFVIVADLGRRGPITSRSLAVLAWSSLFVLVEAASQEVWGRGLFRGYHLAIYGRMTGPYENPIDLATYLMVVIPILLGDSATRRGRVRAWLLGLVAAQILCLGRTEASGAWLGLTVGLAAMCLASRALRRWTALVLLAVLSSGILWLHAVGRLGATLSLLDIGTVDRWAMWQAAIGMIRDRPLLGHGVNTFMANYLDYWVGGERLPRYAHNCYLQVAAETGVLGLAAFLGLLGTLFRRVMDGLDEVGPGQHRMLLGLCGALVAFAIQAGLDTNFYALRQVVLFWVVAGLAVGLAEQGRAGPRPEA